MKRAIVLCLIVLTTAWTHAVFAEEIEAGPAVEEVTQPLRLFGNVGAALDHGAICVSLGARWELADVLTIGVQAEYNPWFSIASLDVAPGAFNTYFTFIFRWLSLEEVELHTTLQLGMSVLLFDLVSAPMGSVGPHVGVGLLGATFRPRERLRVVVEAGEVAMPIPNLKGAPFYYRQYRFTVGLEYRL